MILVEMAERNGVIQPRESVNLIGLRLASRSLGFERGLEEELQT